MNPAGPMVAVCLAPADLRPEVDALTGAVRVDGRRADLPAAEAAAFEYGIRVAEAWQGWVLVATLAPAVADGALLEASALGARVVRVGVDFVMGPGPGRRSPEGSAPMAPARVAGDPAGVAGSLAATIKELGRPACVLCGDRSGAAGVGAVPAFLAAELGLDQALGLVSVEVEASGSLLATRRLDGGWRERLRITGPAVLSVEASGVRLRRAGLVAALRAGEQRVETVGAPGPSGDSRLEVAAPRPYRPRTRPVSAPTGDAHARLLALTGALSLPDPARVLGPLTPAEAVDELLGYLARHGHRSG